MTSPAMELARRIWCASGMLASAGCWLAVVWLLATGCPADAADFACYQVDPARSPGLAAAVGHVEGRLAPGQNDPRAPLPRVVIWQFDDRHEVSAAWAAALGEHVRRGGSLLLSFAQRPGRGPMRLAFLSPTTGWQPAASADYRRDAAEVAEWDAALFGEDRELRGLRVPFFFEIRPFHAVERGQARYDRYERPTPEVRYTNPGANVPLLPPESHWWTRSLLNRQWAIRARLNDWRASPLLLTGRYGAGRVAVFASSLEGLSAGGSTEEFLATICKWLAVEAVATPAVTSVKLPPPMVRVDANTRSLHVALHNPTGQPLPVEVLGRMLTWESALVGDVSRSVSLPAGGSAEVELPLPLPQLSAVSYQALEMRPDFVVRLGVLSGDGAELLSETTVDADLRSSLRLALATPEARTVQWPWEAPASGLPNRLGLPVRAYTFAPGQTIESVATISHGVSNLAPLAEIRDESDPDNKSVKALNDDAALAERGPDWYARDAYGCYVGRKESDVVLSFTFAQPVWLASIVLTGAADDYRNHHRHNPPRVIVEADGRELARAEQADELFLKHSGRLRLDVEPRQCRVVRICLPWVSGKSREAVWLGEVALEGGLTRPEQPRGGQLTLKLRHVLTNQAQTLRAEAVDVPPLGRREIRVAVPLPAGDAPQFYRLEADLAPPSDQRCQAQLPLWTLRPKQPLLPMTKLQSPSDVGLGFIVTRGFRNIFDTGTGTREDVGGWGNPDDLIWAYQRGLKQQSPRAGVQAGRLYVSDNDTRHYSSPWKPFYNGEEFFSVATPRLVERLKQDRRWNTAEQVVLNFSDRWDLGPSPDAMYGWQDFEGFDAYLRAAGLRGLTGRTRREIAQEIREHYEGPWNAWHFGRYCAVIAGLHDAFAREGKRLVITAQGVPMLPGPQAEVIGAVVRGMSDDCTWGQISESVSLTTARQMAGLAFTPSLAMSTLFHWGYNSAALNNAQWRGAVGTSEPSRRHLYDRAFRGVLRRDGAYTSIHTYGYNNNAGEGFTLTSDDLDARQRVQDLHTLLTPDGPLGAGVVLSTAARLRPDRLRFDCGDPLALPEGRDLAHCLSRLHDAGLSLPFSANAAGLEQWRGTAPLIVTNLGDFSPAEIETLRRLAARGVRMAAFHAGGPLPAAAAALFGVKESGERAAGHAVAEIGGRPLAAQGGCLLIPIPAGRLTEGDARLLTPLLQQHLEIPLAFPPGIAGYGFTSHGRSFIVVEDWREEGRLVDIEFVPHPRVDKLKAVNLNGHWAASCEKTDRGWKIRCPVRPGDGVLLALETTP